MLKKHKLCFSCLDQRSFGGGKSAMRCFINNCVEKHQSNPHFVKKQFFTYNQRPNTMQLETTVIKTSKQARDLIWKLSNSRNQKSNIKNQLQFMPVTFFNNGIKLDWYAIIDKYSSCSYILRKTAENIQCEANIYIKKLILTFINK